MEVNSQPIEAQLLLGLTAYGLHVGAWTHFFSLLRAAHIIFTGMCHKTLCLFQPSKRTILSLFKAILAIVLYNYLLHINILYPEYALLGSLCSRYSLSI